MALVYHTQKCGKCGQEIICLKWRLKPVPETEQRCGWCDIFKPTMFGPHGLSIEM